MSIRDRIWNRYVLNCTKDTFYTYAPDGTIVEIEPAGIKEIPKPSTDTVVIVDDNEYQKILKCGERSTSDLAYLSEIKTGRKNIPIRFINLIRTGVRIMPIPGKGQGLLMQY